MSNVDSPLSQALFATPLLDLKPCRAHQTNADAQPQLGGGDDVARWPFSYYPKIIASSRLVDLGEAVNRRKSIIPGFTLSQPTWILILHFMHY